MLDDLREQTNEDIYTQEDPSDQDSNVTRRYFLGMTPGQRLFIAVLILMMSCLLSTFCLLITEKIDPLF